MELPEHWTKTHPVIHVADVIAVTGPLSDELRFAAYAGLEEPPSASTVILRF
jgi:hypothetical protein